MELIVLGSGTCIPTVDRGPSGLALTFGSHLILFDGGGGSLRPMPRLGLDFRTVDFQRSDPLHVIGPIGLRNFYEKMKEIFGHWIEAHTYPLSFHEADESRI